MDTLPTNESALAENITLKAQLAAVVAELKEKQALLDKVNDALENLSNAALLPSAPLEDHFAKQEVKMALKASEYASALHEIDNFARGALKHGLTEESFSQALERIREEVREVYDVMEGL